MKAKSTFEPAVVGGIEVKNRIFRSATYEGTAIHGKVGDRMIEMHGNLSKGEVGLIITGWISVSRSDQPGGTTVSLTDDSSIPGLEKSTGAVHRHGAKIIAQLNHAGSQLFSRPKGPVYAPSDVIDPVSGIKPTPFTKEQIRELIVEFGDAAIRAKKAGFDGVQLHGAHGYLLNKFLSPASNKRTDEYGGSLSKNIRIVLEILHEIKTKCGKDYPVWIKLNCSDFHPAGQGLNEDHFPAIAEELVENGIDAIEVSGGTLAGKYSPSRPKKHVAYHLEYARKLTEQVDIPVILVGGLRNIDTIESIISETKIDAVSLSRPLIREPELVKRWKNGDRRDAECTACNGCFNPRGTQCFFTLGEEERAGQKEVMKLMGLAGNKDAT